MTNRDHADETQDHHPFTYRKANQRTSDRIRHHMALYRDLYDQITATLPHCRERSLALTKLEESAMWANKGFAFHDHEIKDQHP